MASIVGGYYAIPLEKESIIIRDKLPKNWGVITEYKSKDEFIVEGWLTLDTLTWGASIPLPVFSSLPEITFWRENGSGTNKPYITSKSVDQFSIKISDSDLSGKWMWRARGLK